MDQDILSSRPGQNLEGRALVGRNLVRTGPLSGPGRRWR
jgi:hypothetical protein